MWIWESFWKTVKKRGFNGEGSLYREVGMDVSQAARPRRFGKTLFMDTLREFLIYEGTVENCSRDCRFQSIRNLI